MLYLINAKIIYVYNKKLNQRACHLFMPAISIFIWHTASTEYYVPGSSMRQRKAVKQSGIIRMSKSASF